MQAKQQKSIASQAPVAPPKTRASQGAAAPVGHGAQPALPPPAPRVWCDAAHQQQPQQPAPRGGHECRRGSK
eukprot:12460090-Alexandrium_andersonii.AAC.1